MKLSCKDLDPTSTCDFVAGGATAHDVAQMMMTHAKAEHPADLAKLGTKTGAETLKALEAKVHE